MSWRAAAAAALVTAAVCFLIARGNSYQTFIIVHALGERLGGQRANSAQIGAP